MPRPGRPRTRRRRAARAAQGDLDTAVALVRAVLDDDTARFAAADPLVQALARLAAQGLRTGAVYAAALSNDQLGAISAGHAEAIVAPWARQANDRMAAICLDGAAQVLAARIQAPQEVTSLGA
jgi:hypothetical protein